MNSFLIAMACAHMTLGQASRNDVCSKTLTAASLQIGIQGKLSLIENYTRDQVQGYTGKSIWGFAGAAYMLQHSHRVTYATKAFPFSDSVAVDLSDTKSSIKFIWSF